MRVKKLSETATFPARQSAGAAGYDLHADCVGAIKVKPGESVMIPTNIAMEIPEGYVGLVFARSGLATKLGLRPTTCVSVIDSDYRGGIFVPLRNDSDKLATIQKNERVSQIVFVPHAMFEVEEVTELSDTVRGEKGFGSSGK